MKFIANHVSPLQEGDYCQVWFTVEDESDDVDTPYLIIQPPERGKHYIETHDPEFIGHFRLRRIEFSARRLVIEIDRKINNLLEVDFYLKPSDFKQVDDIMNIVKG